MRYLPLLLLFLSSISWATPCSEEVASAVLAAAQEDKAEGAYPSACKSLPDGRTLAVVAGAVDSDESRLVVYALLDSKDNLVLYSHVRKFQEDASVRIDLDSFELRSPIKLKNEQELLTVRFRSGYIPNCADGGDSRSESFYVAGSSGIKLVLEDVPVASWQYLVEPAPSRCTPWDAKPNPGVISDFRSVWHITPAGHIRFTFSNKTSSGKYKPLPTTRLDINLDAPAEEATKAYRDAYLGWRKIGP